MRVRTVVPVQVTFHVNSIADLQVFHSFVDICAAVAEIRLHAEGVGLSVFGYVEVQIVIVGSGTGVVVVVNNGTVVGLSQRSCP